jgi:predicted CXXCH cytochrome family protein
MSTHFTALGVANELCKKCHDPHGTRNIFMLRTTLSGVNGLGRVHLTITDASTGFVNSAGSGICQLCHTKTKYYLAGIPETAHPDRDCLSCHRHNAKGGAFKPSGTCDGCHGYPPVPTGLANFTFGTTGNYANAKFQDYSGGGGAHAIAAHVSPNAVPADGWKNCAMCHNGGSINNPSHITKMPIKTNIANVTVKLDQKLRFNNTVQVTYSSAHLVYPNNQTGTCNNVECHFKPSPRWSIQR